MMDILDDKYTVSYYRNLEDTTSQVVVPLRAFLKETINPSPAHLSAIMAARGVAATDPGRYKEMKRTTLPNATLSAVCSPKRADSCATPNGLISIDIDGKENPNITDWESFKQSVSTMPQVAFCGLSLSGNGVYLIEPLAYPQNFKEQFEQLRRDFAKAGVVVDKACSNLSRTRVLSYDPHPYLNRNALPYYGVYREPCKPKRFYLGGYTQDETEAKVAALCGIIEQQHITLTPTYDEWLRMGMAFADLGERGRRYFHIVSAQYADNYDEAYCNEKFDNFLRTARRIHIGTFFFLCTEAGVVLPQQHTAELREAARVSEESWGDAFERVMQEPKDETLPF